MVEHKIFVLKHKLCALARSSSCYSTNISYSDLIEFVLEHEIFVLEHENFVLEHKLDCARAQHFVLDHKLAHA